MSTNTKSVHVVVNTEGGVGAADWHTNAADVPSYGPGDEHYILEVPADATPDQITDAMDAYLGEYDLPDGYVSRRVSRA